MRLLYVSLLTFLYTSTVGYTYPGLDKQWQGYVPDPIWRIHVQKRDYRFSQYGHQHKSLPTDYDLRQVAGAVLPIENQSTCGSCYCFGSKGMFEMLVLLRDHKLIEVSGQWMMDCGSGGNGCRGGDFIVLQKLIDQGAVYESEYPIKYEASGNSCQDDWLAGNHYHEKLKGYALIGNTPEEMMAAMFQNEAPLGVTIAGNAMGSGDFSTSCRSGATNHIVFVIGWVTHNGIVYWIVQNSWGTDHGVNGYYYIPIKDGKNCSSLGAEEVVLADYKPACTPQPTASAGPDQNIIMAPGLPHEARIGTPALAGHTYHWLPIDGMDDADYAQVLVSPAKSTLYTVTATSQCGSATSQVMVHVYNEKGRELK